MFRKKKVIKNKFFKSVSFFLWLRKKKEPVYSRMHQRKIVRQHYWVGIRQFDYRYLYQNYTPDHSELSSNYWAHNYSASISHQLSPKNIKNTLEQMTTIRIRGQYSCYWHFLIYCSLPSNAMITASSAVPVLS